VFAVCCYARAGWRRRIALTKTIVSARVIFLVLIARPPVEQTGL